MQARPVACVPKTQNKNLSSPNPRGIAVLPDDPNLLYYFKENIDANDVTNTGI